MNPVEYTGQEQRITFQLYNYWFGLAHDCGIPPLKSLSPADIAPYKNNMVLIDLRDPDNEPTLQVIGQLLAEDIGLDLSFKGVSEIPRRTLLSRITDHYMEVLGNKSPISFDAKFQNKDRDKVVYRGILLPFSDDGENINFILGAIRWITEEDSLAAMSSPENPEEVSIITDTPEETHKEETHTIARLRDSLENCRALVQGQNPADIRSRKSLYEALGAILDFHILCMSDPTHYNELLAAEELKAQKRAPFTPTLKLCFGRDYDKTRLTEYAAALSFAQKNQQDGSSLPAFLDQYPGGIKGCVRAERENHSGHSNASEKKTLEDCRNEIDSMTSLASFDIEDASESDDDLCLLLARRNGPQIDVIKILKKDEKILNSILRQITTDP